MHPSTLSNRRYNYYNALGFITVTHIRAWGDETTEPSLTYVPV